MRQFAHKSIAALTACAAIVLAPAASASAAPSSPTATPAASQELRFSIPTIGGLEFGPGGVPGGSFQPITVIARPAPHTLQFPAPPSSVTFSVVDPAPYSLQYEYRYLLVSWRNLQSGKTGHVALRHWRTSTYPSDRYPASLPTQANAATGSGPVVATVRVLREQWQAPPQTISVISGLTALDVP